jgi:uncharacterized protein with PIN domain
MAVPCRRCGREYDVTLFEYGRTLWCTCGARVGLEPRVRASRRSAEPRFVADAMLGRLARWLRLLGLDCAYDADFADETVVHLALDEGRTLLTRDRRLPLEWWIEDVYVVRAEAVREQLAEVIRRFDLATRIRPLTRCGECNGRLRGVSPSDVAGRVQPDVLARFETFSECVDCGRVYWEGTHADRIRRVAAQLVSPG